MRIEITGALTSVVSVVPGLSAPARFDARVFELAPYDLALQLEVSNGRFVCASLSATRCEGGPAVTTDGLRRVPVAALVRKAASMVAMRTTQPGGPGNAVAHEPMDDVDTARLAAAGPTDETLEFVAFEYQLAHALGEGPTKAVQQRLGLARSTAGRWVDLARKRGFLRAADGPGKASAPLSLAELEQAATERQELLQAVGLREVAGDDDPSERVKKRLQGRPDLQRVVDMAQQARRDQATTAEENDDDGQR